MALYTGMAGSPITYLTGAMTAAQTTATVSDGTALPEAPNLCTIGFGENIETIRYGAKVGNNLSDITRGIEGIPQAWDVGTEVARFFTAYDHNELVAEIARLEQERVTHQADFESHQTDFESHLAESASDAIRPHGLGSVASEDYEEGEFTPTVTGSTTTGTGTYSTRIGNYVRVGRLVFITISLQWTAHTGTGQLQVEGLPFVAAGSHYNALSLTADDLTFSEQLVARIAPNTATIAFRGLKSGDRAAMINMDSSADIYIAGTYLMA